MKKSPNRKRQQTNRKLAVKRAFRKTLRSERSDPEAFISGMAIKGSLRRAAQLAIEKQLTHGVPAVWMEDGVIYKQYPDGRKEKIASHKKTSFKLSQQRFIIQK